MRFPTLVASRSIELQSELLLLDCLIEHERRKGSKSRRYETLLRERRITATLLNLEKVSDPGRGVNPA